MKWFVETRNKSSKERPFELTKELVVDVYLPGQIVRLQNNNMAVNYDGSLEDSVTYIRPFIFDKVN